MENNYRKTTVKWMEFVIFAAWNYRDDVFEKR